MTGMFMWVLRVEFHACTVRTLLRSPRQLEPLQRLSYNNDLPVKTAPPSLSCGMSIGVAGMNTLTLLCISRVNRCIVKEHTILKGIFLLSLLKSELKY